MPRRANPCCTDDDRRRPRMIPAVPETPVSGPIDLAGRVALVTGGARGIGRAIALALAREGADLAVADLLPTDEVVAEARALGRRALGLRLDVTSPDDVAAAVANVLEELGRVDVLVNNAGVVHRAGVEDTTLEMWRRDVDVI